MADSRRLIKVFLASPGDLAEERKAAKTVVTDFNDLWAEEFGYQVELVGWEDTVSIFGRPQEVINRELDRCELFVGLMWRRWGMPPDNAGEYTSGFEEEFTRSLQRRQKDGRPEISLFFKEIDSDLLRDPGADLKRVLAFKEQLVAGKQILFENFCNTREFEKKLMRCISSFVKHLHSEEKAALSGQSQLSSKKGESRQTTASSSAVETPLSVEGANFLREFVAKTEGRANEPVEAVEIARFRLLTSIVGGQANDEVFLGAHDANLIFIKGDKFNLGRTEFYGLIRSGLQNLTHENTPLWRWVQAMSSDDHTLILHTLGPPLQKQINAFSAMRLVSQTVPQDESWIREIVPSAWLHESTPIPVRIAALKYLADCGTPADLALIRGEIDRNDNQTLATAAEAFISISFRQSRESAFAALYELQPSSVNENLLKALFHNPATLSTQLLLRGISHQSPAVRTEAVTLLCERGALPTNLAEELLEDTEARVRYSAFLYLLDHERPYSPDEAKKILVRPTTGQRIGMPLSGASDPEGEACFNNFQIRQLRALKDKDLEMAAAKELGLSRDAYFILVERDFKRRGNELRNSIDDGFKSVLSASLGGANESDWVTNIIRKNLVRRALDILRRKADPCDRERIRRVLRSRVVDCSVEDIQYLGRYGEWEDIHLIVEVLTPQIGESTLLTFGTIDENKAKHAAKAIYFLGRQRLADLLAIEMPTQLLVQVINEIQDKGFGQFSDSLIEMLLRSEDNSIRKAAALKSIKSLPRKRLESLLQQHITGTATVYYNVIHWLDFGISVSRERAARGAQRALSGEYRAS